MPTDETQVEEQENTQPLVTSNEEVDGLIGEMSDEDILNASPDQIDKFLEARSNFNSNHDKNHTIKDYKDLDKDYDYLSSDDEPENWEPINLKGIIHTSKIGINIVYE